MAKQEFQDEVVLPSLGALYAGQVPEGLVTIQMMGTQEERLLAGSRGSGGKIITQLLDRIIVLPKIQSRDLLMVDRMFLLMKLRILTFGSMYGFKMTCPSCESTSRFEVDLSELEVKVLDENFTEPIEVKLPLCGETVFIRLLRGHDEEAVAALVKKYSERGNIAPGDPTYIPTLARMIHHTQSITEEDFTAKLKFVQGLKSLDSLALNQATEDLFGLDLKKTLVCPVCQFEIETSVPFSEEFFRPKLSRSPGRTS